VNKKGLKFKINKDTGSRISRTKNGNNPKTNIIIMNGIVIKNSRRDKSLKTKT
jgi:hypothetical protein